MDRLKQGAPTLLTIRSANRYATVAMSATVTYMNTNTATAPTEVKFTAKRAQYWNAGNMRWQGIARDKAEMLVATGQAADLTDNHI